MSQRDSSSDHPSKALSALGCESTKGKLDSVLTCPSHTCLTSFMPSRKRYLIRVRDSGSMHGVAETQGLRMPCHRRDVLFISIQSLGFPSQPFPKQVVDARNYLLQRVLAWSKLYGTNVLRHSLEACSHRQMRRRSLACGVLRPYLKITNWNGYELSPANSRLPGRCWTKSMVIFLSTSTVKTYMP